VRRRDPTQAARAPFFCPPDLLSILTFHGALNILSQLGILVLFGVGTKNAILQIDRANHLRTLGRDRHAAIVAASRDRLRPILMTTIAFVAGMIPLAVSTGAATATNQAMSLGILGGQTMSLLLTLVAIPVMDSLFDDLRLPRIQQAWDAVLERWGGIVGRVIQRRWQPGGPVALAGGGSPAVAEPAGPEA